MIVTAQWALSTGLVSLDGHSRRASHKDMTI